MSTLLRSTFVKTSTVLRLILILAVAFFVSATFSSPAYACGDSSHVKICSDQYVKDMQTLSALMSQYNAMQLDCKKAKATLPCDLLAHNMGISDSTKLAIRQCRVLKDGGDDDERNEQKSICGDVISDQKQMVAKLVDTGLAETTTSRAVAQQTDQILATQQKQLETDIALKDVAMKNADVLFLDSCRIFNNVIDTCNKPIDLVVRINDEIKAIDGDLKKCLETKVALKATEATRFLAAEKSLAAPKTLPVPTTYSYRDFAPNAVDAILDIGAKTLSGKTDVIMAAIGDAALCDDYTEKEIVAQICPVPKADCDAYVQAFDNDIRAVAQAQPRDPAKIAVPGQPAERQAAEAQAVYRLAGSEEIASLSPCDAASADLDKLQAACPYSAALARGTYGELCIAQPVPVVCVQGTSCPTDGATCTPAYVTGKCTCGVYKDSTWACLPGDFPTLPVPPLCEMFDPIYACSVDGLNQAKADISSIQAELAYDENLIQAEREAKGEIAITISAVEMVNAYDNRALESFAVLAGANRQAFEDWWTCQTDSDSVAIKDIQSFIDTCVPAPPVCVPTTPDEQKKYLDAPQAKVDSILKGEVQPCLDAGKAPADCYKAFCGDLTNSGLALCDAENTVASLNNCDKVDCKSASYCTPPSAAK